MKEILRRFIEWVQNWDFMSILYSLIASGIFILLLKWVGLLRFLKRQYLTHKRLKSYGKNLLNECSTLIVIGRRQGFSIKEVFVDLDIAPSNLQTGKTERDSYSNIPPRSFVLVGGPGAGKSTMVKKMIIEKLDDKSGGYPFFIRLREYNEKQSIESHIIDNLKKNKIPEPEIFLNSQLINRHALFVLDGLDEVRPFQKDSIYKQINTFYNKNFRSNDCARLVVTCRKEAYREIPLDIRAIWEVRPLSDPQLQRFADKWPLKFPAGKSSNSFIRELKTSSRILELARSPLLLVGGLMQYTESNLGIPEERFEYLARIAKWLISDWAIAQNHPSDPYRAVYNRILPRLAFHLHQNQKSECPMNEAINLFKMWLPDFGVQDDRADDVLDSILTRTGILVRNTPGEAVFSQFGLQEYFSSNHAADSLTAKQVAELEPKTWWREVILLSIAQLKDPGDALDALFQTSPLLASNAVAECPTPSIDIQQRAIETCLKSIVNNDPSAPTVAISLLRKLTPIVEDKLLKKLETKMASDKKIAPAIASILSMADTDAATAVIAKYPHLWEPCLQNTGYLSTSFENLLIDWIVTKPDKDGELAVDMITSKLTYDRFNQLSDMLPNLKKQRAEQLAVKLLLFMGTNEHHPFMVTKNSIKRIARCVSFIGNTESIMKYIKRLSPHMSIFSAALTSMYIKPKLQASKRESLLARTLIDCSTWCQRSSSLSFWLASGICTLGAITCSQTFYAFTIIAFILLIFGLFRIPSVPPWLSSIIYTGSWTSGITGLFTLLIGITVVFGIGGTLPNGYRQPVNITYILLMSLAIVLTGVCLYFFDRSYFIREKDEKKDVLIISAAIWTTVLVISISLKYFLPSFPIQITLIFASIYVLWLIINIFKMVINWNIVRLARTRMKKAIALFDVDNY